MQHSRCMVGRPLSFRLPPNAFLDSLQSSYLLPITTVTLKNSTRQQILPSLSLSGAFCLSQTIIQYSNVPKRRLPRPCTRSLRGSIQYCIKGQAAWPHRPTTEATNCPCIRIPLGAKGLQRGLVRRTLTLCLSTGRDYVTRRIASNVN